MERVFLTAEWRHLLMLNYEVTPDLLSKYIPRGTELDDWNGKFFISLVGFRFLKTRVYGIAFPFHRNFEEVNLRFYVHRNEAGERRRGVVFIREIVPRRAISMVANTCYNENYITLPMSHRIQIESENRLSVEYGWRFSGKENRISCSVRGEPTIPDGNSQDHFITEHYWGYAVDRKGKWGTEYRVAHPQWRVWRADDAKFEGDAEGLYDPPLASVLRGTPASAFLAEGSEVTVYRGRRISSQ